MNRIRHVVELRENVMTDENKTRMKYLSTGERTIAAEEKRKQAKTMPAPARRRRRNGKPTPFKFRCLTL